MNVDFNAANEDGLSLKTHQCQYSLLIPSEADPDNIDEHANAVRRKCSRFADNFDTLKQKEFFFFPCTQRL